MSRKAHPAQVTLNVKAETKPGMGVRVTGSHALLGNWNPLAGPELTTGPGTYPTWTTNLDGTSWDGGDVEYKFVIVEPGGNLVWEQCSNRQLTAELAEDLAYHMPWFGQVDAAPIKGLKKLAEGSTTTVATSATVASPTASTRPQGGMAEAGTAREPDPVVNTFKGRTHKRCASVPNFRIDDMMEKEALAAQPGKANGLKLPAPTKPQQGLPTKAWRTDVGGVVWTPAAPPQREARVVEVVFDDDASRRLALERDVGTSSPLWTLDFSDTGLKQGVHRFHFLVDGERTLSASHAVLGNSNCMCLNGAVRRYFSTHACQDATPTSPSRYARATSAAPSPTHTKSIARPHSIAADLMALVEAENEEDEDASQAVMCHDVAKQRTVDHFPEDTYQGLFDASLRLRLHGISLPARPLEAGEVAPRLHFLAAGFKQKKASGAECEDAFFVSGKALGVADGVGSMVQFASYGVNSAAYAADLMAKAHVYSESADMTLPVGKRALAACTAAEEQTGEYGASTIAVVMLEGSTIGAANLGDSGYMVLRKGPEGMQIVHRSVEQQHGWNCPFQLMRIPPRLAARVPKYTQDHASDCDLYTQDVQVGDLVLLFSDGLRDNLHDEEVISVVDRSLSPVFGSLLGFPDRSTRPSVIAKALVKAAEIRSVDPRARVPFTVYSQEHGYSCLGGKEDDITVIAAWLVPETEAPDDLDWDLE